MIKSNDFSLLKKYIKALANLNAHYMMDGRLQTPFSMGVFGCRNSGKSVFTKNLLLSDLIDVKKVLWIYKTWQEDIFIQLQQRINIEFVDDLPNFEDMKKQENTIIVIDDYFVEAANNNQVLALFSRGRHLNLSVILLSQNLFHNGKYARDMSLNMDYIVLFRNVRDASQIRHLGQQMYPENKDFLVNVFRDATKEPYSHLFLDLRSNSIDTLRVRANILKYYYQTIYLHKKL